MTISPDLFASKRGMTALYANYPALSWSVITRSLPSRLADDGGAEAQWVTLMGRLNLQVIPADATVIKRNRAGVRAIPHKGCAGYLGRVVALDECVVFSPLAADGLHHDFELCRWTRPESPGLEVFGFRAAARRASQIAMAATCNHCHQQVDLLPYRDEIRSVANAIHHKQARKPGANRRRPESRVGHSASRKGNSNAPVQPQPELNRHSGGPVRSPR